MQYERPQIEIRRLVAQMAPQQSCDHVKEDINLG